MTDYRKVVHGRMQFEHSGKVAGAFTVDQGNHVYLIVAKLVRNKWELFWSYKVEKTMLMSQFEDMMEQMGVNLGLLFTNQNPTENVNDEVVDIVRQF